MEGVLTPNGDTVLYRANSDSTDRDIHLLPVGGTAVPFAASRFSERAPTLSPDGRLVLYVSDESGTNEVYVRPLAGLGRVQVSGNGGTEPRWGQAGREAFYRSGDSLFAVPITRTPSLSVGVRRVALIGQYVKEPYHSNYDVAPDGRGYLFVRSAAASEVTVLLNWIHRPTVPR